jgi:hypothetical protein
MIVMIRILSCHPHGHPHGHRHGHHRHRIATMFPKVVGFNGGFSKGILQFIILEQENMEMFRIIIITTITIQLQVCQPTNVSQ